MKFYITEPCYIRGKFMGQFASVSDPATIEVPDDVEPSRKWIPLDETAQKALVALGRKRAGILTEGLDPTKDKAKYDRVVADVMKQYQKEIPQPVAAKPVVREIATNTEMAEAKGHKVVGRSSDKSPV